MSDQTPAGQSPDQEPPAESTPPPSPTPAAPQGGAAASTPAAGPTPEQAEAARQAEEDEEARRRRRRILALLIVLLILLLLCLGGLAYVLFVRDKHTTPQAGPSTTTSAPVQPTAPQTTASSTPTETATATPTPTATTPTPTQPPVQNITVPDLSGKTAADATTALKQAGFTKAPTFKSGDAGVPFDPTNGSFTVSAQNPAAGTQAPADTEIVLTMTQTGNGGKG